ncbi:MAG: hypothetical protein HUU38_08990 [Anaerolineales bacterium]|nr:hypothetical protein [Anaerolineales bacterium]
MTISFSPKSHEPEISPPVQPRPGERPVDWHARIGLVLAICVLAVEVAIIGLLTRLATWLGWDFPLADALLLAVAVAMAVGGLYGFRWTRKNVLRLWTHEDEDRELARPVQEVEHVREVEVIPSGDALRLAGYKILVLHYVQGREATRPECVPAICTDPAWRTVNTALRTIHAKKPLPGRGWTALPFAEALTAWNEIAFDESGAFMVWHGQFVRFDREEGSDD